MWDESYIKLLRKTINWEHYHDSRTFHLFIHLILCAARKPVKYGGCNLKTGQYLTTYEDLQQDTGICKKYLSESIKKLCESGDIKKETRNGRTLFTVINYSKYQGGNKQNQTDTQTEKPKKDDDGLTYGDVGGTFF